MYTKINHIYYPLQSSIGLFDKPEKNTKKEQKNEYIKKEKKRVTFFSELAPKSDEMLFSEMIDIDPLQLCVNKCDGTIICSTSKTINQNLTITPFQLLSEKKKIEIAKLFFNNFRQKYISIGITDYKRLLYSFETYFIGSNILYVLLRKSDVIGSIGLHHGNYVTHLFVNTNESNDTEKLLIDIIVSHCKKYQGFYDKLYLYCYNENESKKYKYLGFILHSIVQTKHGKLVLLTKKIN